jgi:hypothetical protein
MEISKLDCSAGEDVVVLLEVDNSAWLGRNNGAPNVCEPLAKLCMALGALQRCQP